MDQVMIPQMRLTYQKPAAATSVPKDEITFEHLNQVAPDSLAAYLGMRAIGRPPMNGGAQITRDFNAIPMLAMADIYKMYYANLQEGVGAIMAAEVEVDNPLTVIDMRQTIGNGSLKYLYPANFYGNPMTAGVSRIYGGTETTDIHFSGNVAQNLTAVYIGIVKGDPTTTQPTYVSSEDSSNWANFGISSIQKGGTGTNRIRIVWEPSSTVFDFNASAVYIVTTETRNAVTWVGVDQEVGKPKFKTFDLKNIDKMRMALLKGDVGSAIIVNKLTGIGDQAPYSDMWGTYTRNDGSQGNNFENRMNGLFLKTLLSDRFQTWLETDAVDTVTAASGGR